MHFKRTVICSRNDRSVRFSIKRFLFHRMPLASFSLARRSIAQAEARARVKSGVLARCVEIERFMPELIDSPRYYELYDFYGKSVLIALHVRLSLSFSLTPFPPAIDTISLLLPAY